MCLKNVPEPKSGIISTKLAKRREKKKAKVIDKKRRASKQRHDDTVKVFADIAQKSRSQANVRADHITGIPSPKNRNGRRPDVEVTHNGRREWIEVESKKSLHKETARQLRDLRRRGDTPILGVPSRKDRKAAEKFVEKHGLNGIQVMTPKDYKKSKKTPLRKRIWALFSA